MLFLSELIGCATEIFVLHLFLRSFFHERRHKWYYWAISYGLLGGASFLLSLVPGASRFRFFYSLVCFIIVSLVLFDSRLIQAVFAGISFACLYVLTDILMIVAFSAAGADPREIMSWGVARAVYITITHLVLLIVVLVILAITGGKRTAVTLPFLAALLPGCAAGVIFGLYVNSSVQEHSRDVPFAFFIVAAGFLYLNILIVFFAEQSKAASDREKRLELAEQHFTMQEQYYTQLHDEQEETRAMFHDINKYMQAMRAMVSETNAERACKVMADTQEMFGKLNMVIDVGNSTVSIILNEYNTTAQKDGIQFTFDVSIPSQIWLTEVETFVILGNTLDNAIEACLALPKEERYIRLQLRLFHSILFYKIENPCTEDYARRPRGKEHGYGLRNVQQIANKYQGIMDASQRDGKYTLVLQMNEPAAKNAQPQT